MTIKANLVLDLGNSETRILVQSGLNSQGKVRQKLITPSNRFARIEEGYVLPEGYDESNTVMFVHNGETYVHGDIVDTEFQSSALRPTALAKKYQQVVVELTIKLAFIEGYQYLAEVNETILDEDFKVDWNVALLLPPGDVTLGGSLLNNIVKNIGTINSLVPTVNLTPSIGKVHVLPEGTAAYVGTRYMRGVAPQKVAPRPGYEYLDSSVTLVLDIGAGTSDYFVVKAGTTIDGTKGTSNNGGNNVTAIIRRGLSDKGYDVPQTEALNGVLTGTVKVGVDRIDVSRGVPIAKAKVANAIVGDIISSFEQSQFPTSSIDSVLVCGGGSVKPDIEGHKSLGEHVLESLKVILPEVKMVEIPERINPRHLNIIGAGVLANNLL